MFSSAQKNIKIYKTKGGSMLPYLRENDVLIVKKIAPAQLKIGDIIAYHDKDIESSGIVHRLLYKNKAINGEGIFWAKGDSNCYFDRPITETAIIGKVYFVERIDKFGNKRLLNLDTFWRSKVKYLIAAYHLLLWGGVFNILRYLKRKVRIILR